MLLLALGDEMSHVVTSVLVIRPKFLIKSKKHEKNINCIIWGDYYL